MAEQPITAELVLEKLRHHRLDWAQRFHVVDLGLFGSLARGEGRWDSDADILVVMPFEGRHFEKICQIRHTCQAGFPLDLLLWRPEEATELYQQGDPFLREAFGRGERLAPAQADHHRWSWLDIGPIRQRERHQNNGKASQHQAATIGSPSVKL